MKNIIRIGAIISLFLFSYSTAYCFENKQITTDKTIWYTYPAQDWKTQSLHIGNGYMGGSFYGGVEKESIDIAEKTFWTGGPNVTPNYNYGIIEGGSKQITLIRESIIKGELTKADSLVNKYMKGDYSGFGTLSTVGNLNIDFDNGNGEITDYIRGIDLSKSLGFVEYKKGNIGFSREYFCSYPDKAMVLNLSADSKGKVNFTVSHKMTHKVKSIDFRYGNEFIVSGVIESSGLEYSVRIKVVNKGGEILQQNNSLSVKNADSATILYAIDTEYDSNNNNFKGVDPHKETERIINKISKNNYSSIKKRHVDDYKELFDRVSFSLVGDKELELLPTDKRIEQLKKGMTDDSALKALYFNLGRYLIISASRPGTLPSTLQGVWNKFEKAPWSANYQSNINLQEMYWGCGPTNLPECQEAYIDWIEGLVVPGRKVAKAYYGTAGWTSNATGNIWKYVSPGTDITWGIYPAAPAWHCQHLWSQYDYTRNLSYLKEKAYPIMKEAAVFYLDNLVEYEGRYVLIPSVSAEHAVEVKEGVPVDYSSVSSENHTNKVFLYPAFQDVIMIYDLFSNVISATKELGVDDVFRNKVVKARDGLTKLRVGKYGQLQEWLEDIDNPRDHHRHISHLYALYPGNMISSKTPELFNAAKKSLNMRGEGIFHDRWTYSGGNWSMAWRSACWARLFDGDRAVKVFNQMINETGFENMMSSQSNYMQVDASMATPGVFAEMLIQSQNGYINLLPALPSEWPEGELTGFVSKGGYKLDIKWKYGQLIEVKVYIPKGLKIPRLKLKERDIKQNDPRVVMKVLK